VPFQNKAQGSLEKPVADESWMSPRRARIGPRAAGRHDAVLVLKVLVLQTPYTLSDDQTE
jgi:hypothetical protein